jgi:hypothetical protein
VIEFVSLITGYRALLIVVGVLDSLAFLADRRTLTVAGTDAAARRGTGAS